MPQEIADVGTVLVPGHGVISISQWLEDGIYDTITISAGAVTAGTEYSFFSTLTGKNKDDTNMVERNKLPEGWEIIIMKMGLEICPYTSTMIDSTDFVEKSFLRFETGNSKIRRRGPTYLWPICFGKYDMTAGDVAAAEAQYGHLQIGGTAFSSAPNLLVPIRISPRLNFETILNVRDAMTFSADFRCRFWIYGYISRPVQ